MHEPPRTRHVLIADDHRSAAELLALALHTERPGRLTTEIGLDGREALKSALARLPDIAILDINMPRLWGPAVAAALRDRAGARPLLLVALTGNAAETITPAQRAPFDHVLHKPVGIDVLVALIDALDPVPEAVPAPCHALTSADGARRP